MAYTRETQKLIYWLFASYANFRVGAGPDAKVEEYNLYIAKKELKRLYIKASGYKADSKSLETFLTVLADNTDAETFKVLSKAYIKSIQDFAINNDDFSLCLSLLSQEKANKFVDFLFDFMIEHDIPIRKEIAELYDETQKNKYIFSLLLHKKCCVCGKPITGPHHIDRVGTQGYKNDTGLDKRLSPLCPYHHAEIETGNYTNEEFKEKYPSFDYMLCDEKQIEILKDVYPHHFQAFKRGVNEI